MLMPRRGAQPMDRLLSAMKAAAEPTRLRLLVLCAHADLTVTDLVHILGQSQPRLSRHLKLLAEAGLLDRSEEHTSELQSLMRISYAVFCLKKKNTKQNKK